jgi:hypothetical protein
MTEISKRRTFALAASVGLGKYVIKFGLFFHQNDEFLTEHDKLLVSFILCKGLIDSCCSFEVLLVFPKNTNNTIITVKFF